MKYKKIQGESIPSMMVKLRQAFGDDVVIIRTNQIREGGVLGTKFFSRPLFEIEYMLPEKSPSRKAIEQSLENISERTKNPAIRDFANKVKQLEKAPNAEPMPAPLADAKSGELPALPLSGSPEEWQALNRLLADQDPIETEAAPPNGASAMPAAQEFPAQGPIMSRAVEPQTSKNRHFSELQELFLRFRMSPEYVDSVLHELERRLSPEQKESHRQVQQAARELMQSRIRVAPSFAPAPGNVRAVLLLGPTGAGKSELILKLAARYTYDYEVSIYSIDHYRFGATEQLKTFAAIMDIPFHSPCSMDELEEWIHRDGSDLILIDAFGSSFRDRERLERLREWSDAICRNIRTDRVLCLAANTADSILENLFCAFDTVGFDKLILTKLDEADFIGPFIEIADKFDKPFSFVSDGQDVPNDLREAEQKELTQLLFEGSFAAAPL